MFTSKKKKAAEEHRAPPVTLLRAPAAAPAAPASAAAPARSPPSRYSFSTPFVLFFQRECPRSRCDPLAATRCISVSKAAYDSATPGRRPSGLPLAYPKK